MADKCLSKGNTTIQWDLPADALNTSSPLRHLINEIHEADNASDTLIRLTPTEGLESPLQRFVHLANIASRYLHARPSQTQKAVLYPDILNLQNIYENCCQVGSDVFNAKFFIPDFTCGMQSMQLAIQAFSNIGDSVLSIDPIKGGHALTSKMLTKLGRRCDFVPFDMKSHSFEVDKFPDTNPSLVYLDATNTLYPYDIASIKERYPTATIVFDGSQMLGLIAGKQFPNPLETGADVLVGSTHKSLCGPQKAIAATNNPEIYRKLMEEVDVFISNNHIVDIAALAVTLHEAEEFGEAFAIQMLMNSNELALRLSERGFQVFSPESQPGFTGTQHVWVSANEYGLDTVEFMQNLADTGIVVNTLEVPRENGGYERALRLGTTEITRRGATSEHIYEIAEAILLVAQNTPGALKEAKERMVALTANFKDVHYSYPAPQIGNT